MFRNFPILSEAFTKSHLMIDCVYRARVVITDSGHDESQGIRNVIDVKNFRGDDLVLSLLKTINDEYII
jgi:hypothetical protein